MKSIMFSSDGKSIVTASNRTVQVYTAGTGELRRHFVSQGDCIGFATFASDGRYIASGSDDGAVQVWDMESPKYDPLQVLNEGMAIFSVLHSLPVGSTSPRAGDRKVWVWKREPSSWTLLHSLDDHSDRIPAVKFFPDDTQLISGSADGTMRIWDAWNGKLRATDRDGLGAYDSLV